MGHSAGRGNRYPGPHTHTHTHTQTHTHTHTQLLPSQKPINKTLYSSFILELLGGKQVQTNNKFGRKYSSCFIAIRGHELYRVHVGGFVHPVHLPFLPLATLQVPTYTCVGAVTLNSSKHTRISPIPTMYVYIIPTTYIMLTTTNLIHTKTA